VYVFAARFPRRASVAITKRKAFLTQPFRQKNMLLLRHAGSAAAARLARTRSGGGGPCLVYAQPSHAQQQQRQQQHHQPPEPLPRSGGRPAAAIACRSSSTSAATSATAALSAADHQAIIQLIHRFDDHLNRGLHGDLGAFFVGSGGGGAGSSGSGNNGGGGGGGSAPTTLVPIVRILPPGAPAPIVQEGLPAILCWFSKCAPMAQGNRHLLLNSIVEPMVLPTGAGGDLPPLRAATVRSSRLLVSATTPPALRASGVVEDVIVRVGGAEASPEWRLLSRDLLMDPPPPPPAAAPAA
jgi:hypothetical protein